MNLELLNQFGQSYPETADGTLDCVSVAVTCVFNKFGTLLAVGCNDGRIYIWDFLTRGVAKILITHVHPVCSLSWSRNGKLLISAATDNTVCITEVLSGQCTRCYRFPLPVTRVQVNPRNQKELLVCLLKHPAILINLDGGHKLIPLREEISMSDVSSPTANADHNIVAAYDRRGKHIYTGNGRGQLLVVQADQSLKPIATFAISAVASTVSVIKSIDFPRHGSAFLVNSADRIIRVYDSEEVLTCGLGGEPEPLQRLQDNVNRTLWKRATFSGDGEYVCGGSARQHSLYVWERASGTLVKILHGTKGELLLDIAWHPYRPVIAAVASGVVSIWAQSQVENWSAFAPDFKELDENVEYDERESEFDVYDEDKQLESQKDTNGKVNVNDEEIDVVTEEPIAAYLSSDEEKEDPDAMLYLPVAPEVEEPEELPICGVPVVATGTGGLQLQPQQQVAAEATAAVQPNQALVIDVKLADTAALAEAASTGAGSRRGGISTGGAMSSRSVGAAAQPKGSARAPQGRRRADNLD